MYPLLHDGDVVKLRKVPFAGIKTNDIICFQKQGKLITHRVLYKSENYLITRGDNATQADGKVYKGQILGKITKVKRGKNEFSPESLYLIQSTVYFQEIVRVTETLKKVGLSFVILKGLPLHLYYEGKHAQRLFYDCDILVGRKLFGRFSSVLTDLGYKPVSSDLSKGHKKLKDKEPEVTFFKDVHGMPVYFDIHLEAVFLMTQLGKLEALYSQKLLDTFSDELRGNTKNISIQDNIFTILAPEYLFIYLALHLFHHNFTGAYRFELMDALVKKEKFQYAEIARIVRQYKLGGFLIPVLLLMRKYYQTEFPRDFLRQIAPDEKKKQYIFKSIIPKSIFNEEGRVQGGTTRFKMIFLLSQEPMWKKILVFLNRQVIYSVFWVLILGIRVALRKTLPMNFLVSEKPSKA